MRTTTEGWDRRDAVVSAVSVAVSAVGAVLAIEFGHLWLWLVAIAGSVPAMVKLAVAIVKFRVAESRERLELSERFMVAPGPIAGIVPWRLGVDPAAGDLLPGGLVPDYVDRDFDKKLRERAEAAASGRGPAIVIVDGPSKVGKSRALFEALRVLQPEPVIVAPVNGAAVKSLMVPGQEPDLGRVESSAVVVLWLDDLERFINEGVNLGQLQRWQGLGRRRIVVATTGGKTVTEPAVEFESSVRSIVAAATVETISLAQAADAGPLVGRLPPGNLDLIRRYGLAAVLVAGPDLQRKLNTAQHVLGAPACWEGVAVVMAAIDWARTGRTDPISRDKLRELWEQHYLPSDLIPNDELFTRALDWSMKPVAGRIALLYRSDGYLAYDYVVRVHAMDADAPAPKTASWNVAIETAQDEQAVSVASSAYSTFDLAHALLALDRAAESADVALVAVALFNRGVVLGELGRTKEALASYDKLISTHGADPSLREQVAKALVNRGVTLAALGRAGDAITCYEELPRRYSGIAALRGQVVTARVNRAGVLTTIGRDGDALASYAETVATYLDDPEAAVRDQVAKALLNRGELLAELGRAEEALSCFDQFISAYAEYPSLRKRFARALAGRGGVLVQLGSAEDGLLSYDQLIDTLADDDVLREDVADALFNRGVALANLKRVDEAIASFDRLISAYDHDPSLYEQVAKALVNRAAALEAKGHVEEAVASYDQLIAAYSDDPTLRFQVVTARLNRGFALAKLGRADEAMADLDHLIKNHADDFTPGVRQICEMARSARLL